MMDPDVEEHRVIKTPPVTVDTVFTLVREVKNWRKLAKELVFGAYDQDDEGRRIIVRTFQNFTDLDALQRQHGSDEECLKSVIEKFLQRKGCRYKQPSWRAVIWSLYLTNEIQLASHIKSYGEPLQDASLTVGNVTKVMEMVPADRMTEVWRKLGVPESLVEMISGNLSTTKEKTRVCVDLYLNCYPDEPSWRDITSALLYSGETAAAREAKAFYHQNDPKLTVENVTRVMEKVTLDKRREVWEEVLGERAVEEIYSSRSSEEEKLHSCADTYVTCRPDSSWERLVQALYFYGEMAAAKEAKAFLQQEDPSLTAKDVTDVMEKVTMDKRRRVWERVLGRGGESHVDEIYSSHSSEKEKSHACSDIYINSHPESSWEHLTSLLYEEDEMTAVDQARPFLPPRDLTLTTDRLTELFQSVDDYMVDYIGELLGLPQSALEETRRSYQSKAKRKDAYLDTYTHRHPCPSWKKISEVLRRRLLRQQADEVENTYVQVSQRTRHNFDSAMKDGYAMIRNGSVFFLGPGGSGKTHTLHSLLEEEPPSIRQSTPCAKRTVRTIAQCKVGVKDIHFVRIKDDQYSDMLSTTAKQLPLQPPSVSTTTPPPAQPSTQEATSEETDSASNPASSEDTQTTDSHTTKQEASASIPDQKLKKSHRSGFEREMLRRMQLVPKRSENLIDKDLIDMKDSGGQPMFHEVLPLFVKNTTFGILTVKLNESLDVQPMVDYYSNGKPVGEPFPSPFTHLQTFRHCMRVLQSTCSQEKRPKLVFIGTHKDKEQECKKESRREKNRKLRSIIPPELKDSVLYCEDSEDGLLFAVNVKTPKNEDRETIGKVRKMMIAELRMLPQQKIPLQYFALENAFLRLARYQHKAILSKEECFREATAYHFTEESFDAALKYLHGLKLIFYYEEVLPDVVFIDAQTILDKITELVEYSLSSGSTKSLGIQVALNIEEFKAYGIVTLELLSQFSSHYVPGLFMQQQLVLLLKYLRVIAEVGRNKYLMPCLLKVTALHRPLPHSASSSISALLFYFGPNGPKLGVYCCLLASLITEAKWELLTENDRPVQVSRNQVQFKLPGNDPGAITITDSFSTSFHVSIDFPEDMDTPEAFEICNKICPSIRETILSSIRKVSHKLNYNNSIPAIAFPCSKHLPNTLHAATISSTGFLTCTVHPASVYSRLTEQHQIWLGEADKGASSQDTASVCSSSTSQLGATPSLGKLSLLKTVEGKKIKIIESVAPLWQSLGDQLEFDKSGSKLELIKATHPNDPKACCRDMFQHWLNGNGVRPCSWGKLVELLEDCDQPDLAKEVQDALN